MKKTKPEPDAVSSEQTAVASAGNKRKREPDVASMEHNALASAAAAKSY